MTSSLCQKAGVPHHEQLNSRRDFLTKAGMGFGALAYSGLVQGATAPIPTAHHFARAKSVIFLFMEGGPSQLDTFDYKPLLNKLAGQPLPESFQEPITAMGEKGSPLLEAPRTWTRHGESGLWVSELLPNIAQHVDDLAVIRSCWGNGINHAGGMMQMHTCTPVAGRPSLGAWVTYGLGSDNENLPAYVVMKDANKSLASGARNYGSGFMPATYQGTLFQNKEGEPLANLSIREGESPASQREKLELLQQFNREHYAERTQQSELDARIRSYELAFKMQSSAPEAVALEEETAETLELYGINNKESSTYGKQCLLARRLVERGVRFIQMYHGTGSRWDSHSKIETNHPKLCREMDQPVAGLLTDLKQRGLLDDTLVIWGGEFGRTPMSEQGNGRDHNPTGFTMWMAGGGVQGGQTIGATDDLGLYAVEDKMHVSDLHSSILHLLGLDNMELTFDYQGRPERPTINEGRFNRKLIGG
ncbi:hypothetical protein Pla110_29770 [Polystyrenella longa]|uniref:Sulfatase n=1 Tax=Polystyrenella longa TaxID=2528007 RepID=A0A518CPU9_9PLAN|nr:DUF1501 domain-containing protein [Polystyrenella longa]QDU81238.1 hypothetical protein Pla110_29770 [Polystyrenella longa]